MKSDYAAPVLKKYIMLLRKINLTHNFGYFSLGNESANQMHMVGNSECILNEQVVLTNIEQFSQDAKMQLHIVNSINNEHVQLGKIIFDMNNEKIVKPLSKEYFSKHFQNKLGYIEYKFIRCETKRIKKQDIQQLLTKRTQIELKLSDNKFRKDQVQTLLSYITEKDQIIQKLNQEVARLITQTKKMQRNLTKQKQRSASKVISKQKIDRSGISLNVNVNPSSSILGREAKLFQKQRQQYKLKIDQLWRKIQQYEDKEDNYLRQIQKIKKQGFMKDSIIQYKNSTPKQSKYQERAEVNRNKSRSEYQQTKDKSDIKQIYEIHPKQSMSQYNKNIQQKRQNKANNLKEIRQQEMSHKQISYLQAIDSQQKAVYLAKIKGLNHSQLSEAIYQKEQRNKELIQRITYLEQELFKKDEEIRSNEMAQIKKDRLNYRDATEQKINTDTQKNLKSFIELENSNQQFFQKQIARLSSQNRITKQKLGIKQEQITQILKRLQKSELEISKLEDQNIELRKQINNKIRQIKFEDQQKNQARSSTQNKSDIFGNLASIEKRQINDEKLKTQIQDMKYKIKRMQAQYEEKIKDKQLQLMKLKLSEKSAVKEKNVYASRIQQMMKNVQGDRKSYLQALQGAHKFQTMESRAKQLQIENQELHHNNFKITKQKQDCMNQMKKIKAKIDQRQGQWVRLKSIESQHDYYKNQCQKFEKANKKFEKQYQILKEYAQNVESVVGKKPRKSMDQNINKERQQKYKEAVRQRLQTLTEETRDLQSKFYLQQVQIWLTERTNIVQYYAKKLQTDKKQINEMDDIKQEARKNLIQEKIRQNLSLKEQEIEDVDRKVDQLKKTVSSLQSGIQKSVGAGTIDWQKKLKDMEEKLEMVKKTNQAKKKETEDLKNKVKKMTQQLEEERKKISINVQQASKQVQPLLKNSLVSENQMKFSSSGEGKVDDLRKSYLDDFKKSKDFLMSKPFEDLKKMNSQLVQEKNKLDLEVRNIKFSHQKERLDIQDLTKGLERQIAKLQHDIKTSTQKYQKNITKATQQNSFCRVQIDQMQRVISQLLAQLNKVSKQVETRQRQSKELASEIKRLNQALDTYEIAEKKLLEDVKKLKDNLITKQLQTQTILQERNNRFLKISKLKDTEIQKLQSSILELQQKLQKEIYEALNMKQQIEQLLAKNNQYDQTLKQKQQEYQLLNENHQAYIQQTLQKIKLLEEQNGLLQNNILQIADEIKEKQIECEQLSLKLEYSSKKQDSLNKIKISLQKKNEENKAKICNLQQLLQHQQVEFGEKSKEFEKLKSVISKNSDLNLELNLRIVNLEQQIKQSHQEIHEKQKQIIMAQQATQKIQIRLDHMKQKFEEQKQKAGKVEQSKLQQRRGFEQKIIELEKAKKQLEQRRVQRHKSRQERTQQAMSPTIRRSKLGATSTLGISKNNSNLGKPAPLRSVAKITHKGSNDASQQDKDKDELQNSFEIGKKQESENLIRYSTDNMQLHIRKPQAAQNIKNSHAKSGSPSRVSQASKIQIDVNESDDQGNKGDSQNAQRSILQDYESPLAQVEEQYQQNMMDSAKFTDYNVVIEENNRLKDELQYMIEEKTELLEKILGLQSQAILWKKQCEKSGEQPFLHLNVDSRSKSISDEKSIKFKESFKSKSKTSQRDDIFVGYSNKQLISNQEFNQLQEKLSERQLTITQLQMRKKQLEDELAEQKDSVNKLMKQTYDLMDDLQKKHQKTQLLIQNHSKEIFQIQNTNIQLENKIEEMTLQILKKDETITETLEIVEKQNKNIEDKLLQIESIQYELQNTKMKLEKTVKSSNKNKTQFRKYQEEAQLQILHLKQLNQSVQQKLKQNRYELDDLAEKYIELQQTLSKTKNLLNEKQQQIKQSRSKQKQAQIKYNNICSELKRNQGSRDSFFEKLGNLQIEINTKNQQIRQQTKDTAILIKKNHINLEAQKAEHQLTKKRLKERQQHISNLKLEIARYNQQCAELQKDKKALGSEIIKMEKQLKDIMNTFEKQLDELNKDKNSAEMKLEKQNQSSSQYQHRYSALKKQLTKKQKQVKQLNYKIEQMSKDTQKLKQKHRKELSDTFTQLQLKNNQYEKVKVQLERESEHYFTKQCEYITQRQKRDSLQSDFKGKLEKYEETIRQMSIQFKQIESRPSSQQWEQICFENELFKNRIQQLQGQLKNSGQKQHEKIYSQFRRYKINKQRELQDMEVEMQKYDSKFQDFQQNNYVLKKDNEAIKGQLRAIAQQKLRMQKTINEYEEDLRELKGELQFYKNKRVEEINKLLHENYD